MTTKELRHRAEIALACLPDAPFRKILGQLFDDMLAAPSTSLPVVEFSWTRKYADSTPDLHVGNSAFEDWFQQQPFACQPGIKQLCRDSYAAGMGDPLVTYATSQAAPSTSLTRLTVKQRVDIADICANMDWDNKYINCIGAVIDLVEAAHGIKGGA